MFLVLLLCVMFLSMDCRLYPPHHGDEQPSSLLCLYSLFCKCSAEMPGICLSYVVLLCLSKMMCSICREYVVHIILYRCIYVCSVSVLGGVSGRRAAHHDMYVQCVCSYSTYLVSPGVCSRCDAALSVFVTCVIR
jgi:hypothetical protein